MNQNYPELIISKQFEGAFLWQLKMADDASADSTNNKNPPNSLSDEPAKVALNFTYAPLASEDSKASSATTALSGESAGKRDEDDIVTSLQSMDLAGNTEMLENEKEFCASYTFQALKHWIS